MRSARPRLAISAWASRVGATGVGGAVGVSTPGAHDRMVTETTAARAPDVA